MTSSSDNRARWQALIEQLERSGLSHRAFAQRHKLKLSTLRSWIYRLRQGPSSASTELELRFLPLTPTSSPAVSPTRPEGPASRALFLHVGPRLGLSFADLPDPDTLARFVAALLEVAEC